MHFGSTILNTFIWLRNYELLILDNAQEAMIYFVDAHEHTIFMVACTVLYDREYPTA